MRTSYYASVHISTFVTQLNHLGKQVKYLYIHWIEAHKGHAGNKKADEMARFAEFRTIKTMQ